MELCKLCLRSNLRLRVLVPDGKDVEEGGCCLERVGGVASGPVLSHFFLALGESLQSKVLAVRARSSVVEQSVLGGMGGLCLLELLHQLGGVGGACGVGGVQASSEDALDNVETHWTWSAGAENAQRTPRRESRTPVGDNGLEALQLGRSPRKGRQLQALELGGD